MPFRVRDELAAAFDLAAGKARVIVPNGRNAKAVPIGQLLPNKYSRGPER